MSATRFDLIALGRVGVDLYPQQSGVGLADVETFAKSLGGSPSNVAVACARLGDRAAIVTKVGDDPFGHYLDGVLRAEGVDTRGLRFSADARTTLAFVSLRADGERSFVFYRHPSADMLMRPEDVALDVIDTARIFHYGSITMIGEPSRSATLAAVDYARSRGLFVSYDPNLRLSLWSDEDAARAGMLAGLDYAHLVKVSDEELDFLTGGSSVDPLWRPDMRLIVVTHGAGGATLYTRGGQIDAPGFRVTAVDTTGAGDGFVAGLLVGLLESDFTTDESALVQKLRFANAVGAMTTTRRGAIPALPTRSAGEAFLGEME